MTYLVIIIWQIGCENEFTFDDYDSAVSFAHAVYRAAEIESFRIIDENDCEMYAKSK